MINATKRVRKRTTTSATTLLSLLSLLSLLLLAIINGQSVSAEALPNMNVALLSYTPDPVQPGQTIEVVLEASNDGNPTEDAWLEIIPEYPFTILPTEDVERAKHLGVVSGTQKLQFLLRIDKNIDDGTIPLKVRYAPSRNAAAQERQFAINIETFDATLSINTIKQEPARLEPGSQGEISLTITNYDDQPLSNIDLLLDLTNSYDSASNMDNMIAVQAMINARLEDISRRIASGQSPLTGATPMSNDMSGGESEAKGSMQFRALAPVGESTRTRIPNLEPGETTEVTLQVQALPDATAGIYAVPFFINYNDVENNPFHTRAEVPIVIDVPVSAFVEMTSTSLRSTDFAGDVVITVANRGLGEFRYTTVELVESDSYRLITAPRSVYVGTLGPGEKAETTFTILPEEELLELPVKVTFRDSFNQPVEIEKTLTLEIINRNYYRDMPYEMIVPWLIAGLVLLLVTGYYLRTLKKTGKGSGS